MSDPTELARRVLVSKIHRERGEREILEEKHGQVWNTEEVQEDFRIEGFLAPFVVVIRESDQVKGTLMFQHSPRFYFDFTPA